jgi:CRP-like cAMP-binding protein
VSGSGAFHATIAEMAIERPTPADRAAFRAHVRRVAALDGAELALLDGDLRTRRLPAGSMFLCAGDVAVDCGLVLSGLAREYFPLADGREVTRRFAGPGDFIGSLSDLLSGQAAQSSARAESDVRIVVVPWRKMRELVVRRPAWADFQARITQRLYLLKSEREFELLALDAEARYRRFRAAYAELEPAIALRHVASYVGITPEHLSRLRRRLGLVPRRSPAQRRPGSRTRGPGPSPGASRPGQPRARRSAPASLDEQ